MVDFHALMVIFIASMLCLQVILLIALCYALALLGLATWYADMHHACCVYPTPFRGQRCACSAPLLKWWTNFQQSLTKLVKPRMEFVAGNFIVHSRYIYKHKIWTKIFVMWTEIGLHEIVL